MGVLNTTPDSFSDGGQLQSVQQVVDRAASMISAGADVLDVGGESTRPGGAPVDEAEERARGIPAITALRKAFPSAAISVDTYKPGVAQAAIEAGADIINDVWGGLYGWTSAERCAAAAGIAAGGLGEGAPASRMAETAAMLGCPVILMHNRPDRDYGDFLRDVVADLNLSRAVMRRAGVPEHQLWLDPGFGFAKEPRHNLEVLRNLGRIVGLGLPVLLGTSRKSTIGLVLRAEVGDRLEGTAATVVWGIQQGCRMVRVHDVGAMLRFVRMADAIRAGIDWKP